MSREAKKREERTELYQSNFKRADPDNLLRTLLSAPPPAQLNACLLPARSPIGQETLFDSLSARHWTGAWCAGRSAGRSHPSGRSLQRGSFVALPTASSRLVMGRRMATPRAPPSSHQTTFCACTLAFLSFAKTGGKPCDWPGGGSECRRGRCSVVGGNVGGAGGGVKIN